jgi:hypothetical protein
MLNPGGNARRLLKAPNDMNRGSGRERTRIRGAVLRVHVPQHPVQLVQKETKLKCDPKITLSSWSPPGALLSTETEQRETFLPNFLLSLFKIPSLIALGYLLYKDIFK